MPETQKAGPFFIERNGMFVMIRSQVTFSARLCTSLPVRCDGIIREIGPMALTEGQVLILIAVGEDDVVVYGGEVSP